MPLQEMIPLTIEGEQFWAYRLTYPVVLHQHSADISIDPICCGEPGDWLLHDKRMNVWIMTPEGYDEVINARRKTDN